MSAASTGPSSSGWRNYQARTLSPCADGCPRSTGRASAAPPALQARHAAWQEQQLQLPAHEHQLRRARQLALSPLDLDEDYGAAERQLLRWRYPGPLAREAVEWAGRQRCSALLSAAVAEMGTGAEAR
ncbi:MAG: hypothetical protein ABSE77_14370 [Acidimicrobiales bacterium]